MRVAADTASHAAFELKSVHGFVIKFWTGLTERVFLFHMGKTRFAFMGFAAVISLWLAVALLTAHPKDPALYPAGPDAITIYVINNGIHSDIALPADLVMKRGGILAQAGRAAGKRQWLMYGWGDAGFYTESGLTPARVLDGLRALFWISNPSVIRVYGTFSSPDKAFADPVAYPVKISPAGFEAMARHIEASFVTENGDPVPTPVVDNRDPFFRSREKFSMFRVCNNWTSDQLAAAGLPTTPAFDTLGPVFALDLKLRAGVKRP